MFPKRVPQEKKRAGVFNSKNSGNLSMGNTEKLLDFVKGSLRTSQGFQKAGGGFKEESGLKQRRAKTRAVCKLNEDRNIGAFQGGARISWSSASEDSETRKQMGMLPF